MSEYERIVQKIQESEAFRNSQTYRRLLTYLVQCANRNETPKETAIAIDVFGRDASFNPSEDTLVRVHMYKLRKKLKQYYEETGKEDSIRIQIPKGSYGLVFEQTVVKEPKRSWSSEKGWAVWGAVGGLALLMLGALGFWAMQSTGKEVEVSPIWEDMLMDEDPVQIVFGDIYVFLKEDSVHNKTITIRDPAINSGEELQQFLDTSPEIADDYQEYPYTFLIKNSVFSLQHLNELIGPVGKSVQLRLLSHFGTESMYDSHTIYVGLFKSMGLFKHYLSNSSIQYQIDEGGEQSLQVFLDNKDTVSLYAEGNPEALHTDFGWFAKYPGPNNHTLMLFGGFHDTGVLQAVRYLTTPSLIQQLEEQMEEEFGEVPPWFQVVFEVQGINRTEIQPRIRYIFPIQLGDN